MEISNRQTRDLSWCIHQPALVSAGKDERNIIFPDDSWFASQAIDSSIELEQPPEYFRLGIYFEQIFQRWLECHGDYRLIEANLQIQGEGRTLGEFDLLVDVNGEVEHWELAVKFYINRFAPTQADQWFGPDPKDTLATKLHRLQNHQLLLADHPDAQAMLDQKNIQVSHRRCIVKGRLYHPWQTEQELPEIVNTNHLRGWWLASEDHGKLETYRIAYLSKKYWLSNLTEYDTPLLLTQKELIEFLAETTQIAPQFALLDENSRELSRGFLLKPKWFELAK